MFGAKGFDTGHEGESLGLVFGVLDFFFENAFEFGVAPGLAREADGELDDLHAGLWVGAGNFRKGIEQGVEVVLGRLVDSFLDGLELVEVFGRR